MPPPSDNRSPVELLADEFLARCKRGEQPTIKEYCDRHPDLIVKLEAGRGTADLLNLLLEVSGQKKKEKDAKVQTAKTMWVPAVNNLGTFGRWSFLEIDAGNLHKTKQEIRKLLRGG